MEREVRPPRERRSHPRSTCGSARSSSSSNRIAERRSPRPIAQRHRGRYQRAPPSVGTTARPRPRRSAGWASAPASSASRPRLAMWPHA
jgi:hypothetical protein